MTDGASLSEIKPAYKVVSRRGVIKTAALALVAGGAMRTQARGGTK
jgi:hypothetical protein